MFFPCMFLILYQVLAAIYFLFLLKFWVKLKHLTIVIHLFLSYCFLINRLAGRIKFIINLIFILFSFFLLLIQDYQLLSNFFMFLPIFWILKLFFHINQLIILFLIYILSLFKNHYYSFIIILVIFIPYYYHIFNFIFELIDHLLILLFYIFYFKVLYQCEYYSYLILFHQ